MRRKRRTSNPPRNNELRQCAEAEDGGRISQWNGSREHGLVEGVNNQRYSVGLRVVLDFNVFCAGQTLIGLYF